MKAIVSTWFLLEYKITNTMKEGFSHVECTAFPQFAVLALFVVFAVAFAAEPAKDLKGSEQFYFGYGAPYGTYAYGAYPYAGLGYYLR